MKYTLAQAAQEVKRSKSSLWRDIKSGKISCEKDENGSYLIDASELFRVHQKPLHEELNIVSLKQNEIDNVSRVRELEVLLNVERERVSEKDKYLDDLKQQVEDAKKDRDHWRQQATYLLESNQEHTKVTWFSKLFGRKI